MKAEGSSPYSNCCILADRQANRRKQLKALIELCAFIVNFCALYEQAPLRIHKVRQQNNVRGFRFRTSAFHIDDSHVLVRPIYPASVEMWNRVAGTQTELRNSPTRDQRA